MDIHLVHAVPLVGLRSGQRRVDGDVREVRTAQPRELRVQVGEQPALQQRVVREIDARHNVRDVECDLLRLSEEVVRVAVEHHAANALHAKSSMIVGPRTPARSELSVLLMQTP